MNAWVGTHPAGLAFDAVAADYDARFTSSVTGRAQRKVIWHELAATFSPGQHVLELNCGTGEDLLFMAGLGISVTALDASERMIQRARTRWLREACGADVRLECLATECLDSLESSGRFDGVFSNFSGLNCVSDLGAVARQLGRRLPADAQLLLCFSTRICLWEVAWYCLRGNFQKAFRRWSGTTLACVGGIVFQVNYPTVSQLRKLFAPYFQLCSVTGVGITVPPSYVEPWARQHPKIVRLLARFDSLACRLPILRVFGDHMLLHFRRVPA